MDINEVKKTITLMKKDIDDIGKLVNDIVKMAEYKERKALKLSEAVTKLEKLINGYQAKNLPKSEIMNFLDSLKRDIERGLTQRKINFANSLSEELNKIDIRMEGQYPSFSAGIFTIIPEIESEKVKIWYGNNQEYLGECSSDPEKVVQSIKKFEHELGSDVDGEEFLKRLAIAHKRVVSEGASDSAPIIAVLYELAHLMQNYKYRSDPQKNHYNSYSRSDFSYDLYRFSKQNENVLRNHVRLTVATRSNTIRRDQFLWVPRDNQGDGTVYSHINVI